MHKALAFLAVVLASTFGIPSGPTVLQKGVSSLDSSVLGVVSPVYRCGGIGTPLPLRISGCDGRCSFIPGQVYHGQKDFIPFRPGSSGHILRLEICTSAGICEVITEVEFRVPPSIPELDPPFFYTAEFDIVLSDVISGQTVELRVLILSNGLSEECTSADIDIV